MSLGKDLASIRKELGISLEEIQNSIKIPMLTLKSIENDSIFDSPEHNQTYIRSFIRSYAKALKIDDEKAVSALDALSAGTYKSSIILGAAHTPSEPVSTEEFAEDQDSDDSDLPDLSPPEIEQKPAKPKPEVSNVNWADMGRKFTLQESGSRVWIIALVAVIVLALVATGYYFRAEIMELVGFSAETTQTNGTTDIDETPPPASDGTIGTPSQEFEEPAPAEVITQPMSLLGDTLTVAIYAAYDRLEPVRVTSDLNGRTNPFWMERGEALYFDFQDTLLIRGQYTRMLILFNGHVVERARQRYYSQEYSSIMLTRNIFDNDTYLSPAPAEFPLEVGAPDSIVYRIEFQP